MTTPPLIEARDLACARGERVLFEGLSLGVHAGEVAHVEGLNGTGKTTLLRVLCGLTQPTAGEVLWLAEPITQRRDDFYRRTQFVGHASGVKLELSPLENLRFSCALRQARKDEDIEDVLVRFGLGAVVDVPCRALSAGQRRRVALARLALTDADLWILDEPLTALDGTGIALLNGLLAEHSESGGAVIFASHQPLAPGTRTVRTIALGGQS